MGTRHCRRPPLGFNVERLLMRVEIVGAQGVLPQAPCGVTVGLARGGSSQLPGSHNRLATSGKKNRLLAADGLSDALDWRMQWTPYNLWYILPRLSCRVNIPSCKTRKIRDMALHWPLRSCCGLASLTGSMNCSTSTFVLVVMPLAFPLSLILISRSQYPFISNDLSFLILTTGLSLGQYRCVVISPSQGVLRLGRGRFNRHPSPCELCVAGAFNQGGHHESDLGCHGARRLDPHCLPGRRT